jgi:AraC family transcriptional regulator
MKPETRSFYEQAVQRTIDHIVGNLDEALDLDTLARDACLSPFHFHRVFRGMVGETPLELIRRLRMERAAWRLVERELGRTRAVTAIAFDAGYDTHEAFTRAFRASYNTSPSGFRLRKHARIELAAPCGVHFMTNGRPMPPFIPRDSGGKAMQVEITEMPAMRVGAVRHIGPYNQITQAFERLHVIVERSGLSKADVTALIAIYYDTPDVTPLDQLRSDAGIALVDGAALPEGLDEQPIPAGRYARTTHVGPYEQLGDVWARFMGEWLPASGHRIGDSASYEIYRNTPMDTPKDQLRTDLYIPLA